jgi:hypothetical protein
MFFRMTAKQVSIRRFSCLMICVRRGHLRGPDLAPGSDLLVVVAVEAVLRI